MNFAELVAENAGEDWIKTVFGKLKTDKERIRIIYNYERTKQPVTEVLSNVQEIYRRKNLDVSESKRLEAENLFKAGDAKKALLYYSQSVLRAPKTGPSLSLALWGRAKVLMSLNEYSLALSDIQLALKENLPTAHKGEAFWKMGVCYKALNEENRASVSFALAEKLLANKMRIDELERDKMGIFIQNKREDRKMTPHVNGGLHPNFPCASKKLKVEQKEGMGRYVVANTEIKTGETLVVEPPYAACLLPEMFGTHCHHCFERLVSPVGCPECSNVAFCNSDCRNTALSTYHQYECKFLDLLIGSGMSILSHTALRMVTQNALSRTLEIYSDRSKEKVYSLCTNASVRPATDFLQRTLMAAFLLRCLQKSGYFNTRDRNRITPTEEELRVGELLLYHLQMLQFNAHEIYELRNWPEAPFKGCKVAYIGVAVYPTVALFNHQCYPAVVRYFVGKNIVIKAARSLQIQEIVAENYGPIFTRKNLQERQRSLLARYWFNCECDACKYNWPTLIGGLEEYTKRIRCPNKNCHYCFTLPVSKNTLKCPKCRQDISLVENLRLLKWCEDQYDIGFKEMYSNHPTIAIDIFCAALDVFHRISNSAPHRSKELVVIVGIEKRRIAEGFFAKLWR
ncbi:hypothetical protein NQ318_014018 [Aromia moschata]|uniref:MYND-type domain-containing protein n=1 Tax=Aromia moschata TaxID=1265417 RepID=A0AAV8YYE8_9CUCU|nr:hypothetical protein NQ318_014018 [Aromia moschata]